MTTAILAVAAVTFVTPVTWVAAAVTWVTGHGLVACFGPAVGAAILAAGHRLARRYATHIILIS